MLYTLPSCQPTPAIYLEAADGSEAGLKAETGHHQGLRHHHHYYYYQPVGKSRGVHTELII